MQEIYTLSENQLLMPLDNAVFKFNLYFSVDMLLSPTSPPSRENTDAHSCNIQPYCLLNHQIVYIYSQLLTNRIKQQCIILCDIYKKRFDPLKTSFKHYQGCCL